MEQKIYNQLRFLRLDIEESVLREGPPHNSFATVTLFIKRNNDIILTGIGKSSKTKDAKRNALLSLKDELDKIPDPCKKSINWSELWIYVKKPIICFQCPPTHWFKYGEILGVDFEGNPPTLVQIACKDGILIDNISSICVKEILSKNSYIHAIFGKHEECFVKNPVNVQYDGLSLAEIVSRTFKPDIRILKNKMFHQEVNWRLSSQMKCLSKQQKEYAALDAEMTRRLGIFKLKG